MQYALNNGVFFFLHFILFSTFLSRIHSFVLLLSFFCLFSLSHSLLPFFLCYFDYIHNDESIAIATSLQIYFFFSFVLLPYTDNRSLVNRECINSHFGNGSEISMKKCCKKFLLLFHYFGRNKYSIMTNELLLSKKKKEETNITQERS